MVFAPLAWLKLQLFLHAGETEIGGFGISAPDDLLYVQDFITLQQVTSAVTVEFADTAVADYFDRCVDEGLCPSRFARIWMHTHPGSSADPSSTDEETFARVFGGCDWSLMFILSRTGQTYARLRFNTGPGGSLLLPVRVDWAAWPQVVLEQQLADLLADWMAEFDRNVHPQRELVRSLENLEPSRFTIHDWWTEFHEFTKDALELSDLNDPDLIPGILPEPEVSDAAFY